MGTTQVRDWINGHSTFMVVVLMIVLLAAAGAIVIQNRASTGKISDEVYFFDRASDKPNAVDRLFVAKSNDIPPILGPSSKTMSDGSLSGVRAYVFTCGACTQAEMFVGYLETYTRESQQALIQITSPATPGGSTGRDPKLMTRIDGGHLWSADGGEWVGFRSPAARAILTEINQRCGEGKLAEPCDPAAE